MAQIGQSPTVAENADFLHKTSVTGPKVDFIQQSTFDTTSFTIPANDQRNLTATLAITDDVGNIKDFEEVIGITNYLEVFVDTNLNYDYEYAVGGLLTSAQKKITISTYRPRSGDTGSLRFVYHFENNDSSSHTIYVESIWDYIEVA